MYCFFRFGNPFSELKCALISVYRLDFIPKTKISYFTLILSFLDTNMASGAVKS